MTLSDEIVELNVDISRVITHSLDIVTNMELGAELLMLLPISVSVTRLTEYELDVNKEMNLVSDVNRVLSWEFEL